MVASTRRQTNAELVNEYLAHCKTLNRSNDTIYSYSRTMSSVVAFLRSDRGNVLLSEVTPDDLRGLLHVWLTSDVWSRAPRKDVRRAEEVPARVQA